MSLKKKVRHRILNSLHEYGWVRNPKETIEFVGHQIYASRGAVSRRGEKEVAWLYALSRHHSRIMDIGCNIGQSSLLFLIGTENQLMAVDPNPDALARCAENLIYNNLVQNARFVGCFCGDVDGAEIDLFSSLVDAASSMHKDSAQTSRVTRKSRTVCIKTVDSIVNETGFKPDLIKIDVEGAEQNVLKGMRSVLTGEPTVFVEMHRSKSTTITENTDGVLEWCKNNHYQAYYLKNHQLISNPDPVKHRGRYHLLLLPIGIKYPKYLKSIAENSEIKI